MKVNTLTDGLRFPEGPVVTGEGRIFCVELLGGSIAEYRRDTKTLRRYPVGGAPNGMMVLDDNTLLFCDSKKNAIRALDLRTGKTRTLADSVNGKPLNAPNDLIQDRKGNILFTCPGGSEKAPVGYMCALTPKGEVSLIADGMYFPNGLLLINDETQIIINETWQHRLIIGEWNTKTLTIENIRPFHDIGGDGEPDGLALSSDNRIHAAVFNTGFVFVLDTEGHLKTKIGLPGKRPTNLCFDHVGDLGLLVTETETGTLLSIK